VRPKHSLEHQLLHSRVSLFLLFSDTRCNHKTRGGYGYWGQHLGRSGGLAFRFSKLAVSFVFMGKTALLRCTNIELGVFRGDNGDFGGLHLTAAGLDRTTQLLI